MSRRLFQDRSLRWPLILVCLALATPFMASPPAVASVGFGDNGILVEEWHYDMYWYQWGWFGSSPAIADLGAAVNNEGTEPDADLEIATGSDELWGPAPSFGVWRVFDSGGNLEWQIGTQTDEARSSLAIADIDGDMDLEMAGGTTSGWFVEVMDHMGSFVWTFPKLPGVYVGGPFVWPSSPAVADLNGNVGGLEVVIGNNYHGNVWCFDGDNSDGVDEGITIAATDFPDYPYPLGTEGTDWDVLWKFETGPPVIASPAIGDVDGDGDLEVVIGSINGNVYVLDGATGSLEHTFTTGGAVYASAALANLDSVVPLEIVVGSTDGSIYCFQWDGTAGSTEWTYSTGGAVYSSAAIGDVDGDGALEVVVGSNDGKVYSLSASGGMEWSYSTGGAVYSSPALADRRCVDPYDKDWPMFRHDPGRTGFYGPAAPITGLDIYVGSEDRYLYLLDGSSGAMIDRFETNTGGFTGYQGIHTSPSVADVDGDNKLEIFFYDWGQGSIYNGHTFWALEDTAKVVPLYAGQHSDIGYVEVWNNASTLYVKFVSTGDCLLETHLHVADSLDGIPQKNGNPIPGKFAYSYPHGCVTEYTYPIPLDGLCGTLYIAAHASLGQTETLTIVSSLGDTVYGPIYSDPLADSDPFNDSWGDSLPAVEAENRIGISGSPCGSDSLSWNWGNGLNPSYEPDIPGVLWISTAADTENWWQDSWRRFSYSFNMPGSLISAEVTVNADNEYWAYANGSQIGWDNNIWNSLMTHLFAPTMGLNTLDFIVKNWAQGNESDPVAQCRNPNGLTFEAEISYLAEGETAWGNSCEGGTEFPGKNWATYFTYTVEPCNE